MPEKILKYSRSAVGLYDGVKQQHSWDCGPASAQVILQAAGVERTEESLIRQIGTTTAGTNHSGLITPILNSLLPGSGYKVVWLTKEPVPKRDVDALWTNVKRSIDADRGAILNFVAPPSNFPRGSNGSTSPAYRGWNTIYHYVAAMGWAIDAGGGRHFWIADPGFPPNGYYCSLEQVASLIVPHSYAYAADAPIVAQKKDEPKKPPPATPPAAMAAVKQTDWDQLWLTHIEHLAFTYGDLEAVGSLVRASQTDPRAARALAHLEKVNPAALRSFISTKG